MIKNLLDSDIDQPQTAPAAEKSSSSSEILGLFDPISDKSETRSDSNEDRVPLSIHEPPLPLADYSPPSAGETVRMTGLAWSAGISLFGSIIFLLIIGWFADLLLGSSPWGIVGGIVLGSVIGFIQFFRMNAEIFKRSENDDK